MIQRQIIEVRTAHPSRDGDGVAIQRIAGMRHAGMDPLLLIDELHSDRREDFAGGFPPHNLRGMQTLTYMKTGGIRHEDSEGNSGEIKPVSKPGTQRLIFSGSHIYAHTAGREASIKKWSSKII